MLASLSGGDLYSCNLSASVIVTTVIDQMDGLQMCKMQVISSKQLELKQLSNPTE